MKLRVATTALAVSCLVLASASVQADTTRAQADRSFVIANMAPPEPQQPPAPPAAATTDPAAAPAADPAAAPAADPAAPAATPPPADPATTADAPAADAAATDVTATAEGEKPAGLPWTWIAIGTAVAAALGFGAWYRSRG